MIYVEVKNMYEILKDINSPDDVKKLNMEELKVLANDIRDGLFNRLTKIGGHFGPNFGIVETEIAMHYVFNSPEDKFIFDVSHQSYPHKMLTGRKAGYIEFMMLCTRGVIMKKMGRISIMAVEVL